MKKLLILVITYIITSGSLSGIQAKDRDIQGVNIITRSQRGADENVAFDDHPEYQKIRESWAESAKKNEELKKNDPITWAKQEEAKEAKNKKNTIRLDYLNQNFFEKFKTSLVVSGSGPREFRRWRRYNDQKSEIVIHHTVSDGRKLKSIEDEKKELRKMYSYHSFTRQRGDIGYNFIIGPSGTIYEGRAGGADVIGAHSVYNNNPSVGIALMGNFEVEKPSSAQVNALQDLIVGLSYKYSIDVNKQVSYHRESNEHPYIETLYNKSVVGHKDTGRTACPGTNLYVLLPQIIAHVDKKLQELSMSQALQAPKIQRVSSILTRVLYQDNITLSSPTTLILPHSQRAQSSSQCFLIHNKKNIGKCFFTNNTLQYTTTKPISTGDYTIITIHNNKKYSLATFTLTSATESIKVIDNTATLERTREQIKQEYAESYSISAPKQAYEKIKTAITPQKIKENKAKTVHVLLYEISFNLDTYVIECSNCIIQSDEYSGTQSSFSIEKKGNGFLLNTAEGSIESSNITIKTQNSSDTITIKNYGRKSYLGIPRNSFYGTLNFTTEDLPIKGSSEVINTQAVVNSLPLLHYLAGIVESNDSESIEHNKTLAILAKDYIIFYLDSANIHPSISKSASYNAIDDPDFFQKYVGAGLSKTLKKRYVALQATYNEYIMYDGELAFTPYFSCSPGFTWSAREKRGRSDTPYLVSQKDVYACEDFKGHGVGMSGRGAAKLAAEGKNYKDIIQYYFSGTKLTTIQ